MLAPALDDIVKVADFRNRQAGITGMLTLQDGRFVQLLEGSPSALDLLMLHLHFDTRHEDIRVVARERIAAKHALTWNMTAPPRDHPLHKALSPLLASPPAQIAPWRDTMLKLMTEPA